MKYNLQLMIILLFAATSSWGQQLEVSGLFSSSTAKEYQNCLGYELGYNHFFKKNRFGVSFRQSFYNTEYDDIRVSTSDGVSMYIQEYAPQNRRIALNLTYSNQFISNEKSNLYIGGSLGLNYFQLKGNYSRIANGNLSYHQASYEYAKNNRIGLGILIEYELLQIISERISTSIKLNPELTSFDEFGTEGGYSPSIIGWLNCSIGVKYNFK